MTTNLLGNVDKNGFRLVAETCANRRAASDEPEVQFEVWDETSRCGEIVMRTVEMSKKADHYFFVGTYQDQVHVLNLLFTKLTSYIQSSKRTVNILSFIKVTLWNTVLSWGRFVVTNFECIFSHISKSNFLRARMWLRWRSLLPGQIFLLDNFVFDVCCVGITVCWISNLVLRQKENISKTRNKEANVQAQKQQPPTQ